MSKKKQDQVKDGDFPSIYKNLKLHENKFKPILQDFYCNHIEGAKVVDCHKCMNLVYNFAEVVLSKMRLGKTKTINMRYFYLARRLESIVGSEKIEVIQKLAIEIYQNSEGKER